MRSGLSAQITLVDVSYGIRSFVRRQFSRIVGTLLIGFVALGVAALATWNVADPSFSHATQNPVTNAVGYPGAVFADLATQFFGLAALAALVPLLIWGIALSTARGVDRKLLRAAAWFGFGLLASGIAGCFPAGETWPLPSGLGGVFGDIVLKIPGLLIGAYPTGFSAIVVAIILATPCLALFVFGSGFIGRLEPVEYIEEDEDEGSYTYSATGVHTVAGGHEEDEPRGGFVMMGALTHWLLSARSTWRRVSGAASREAPRQNRLRQAMGRIDGVMDDDQAYAQAQAAPQNYRVEPDFAPAMQAQTQRVEPSFGYAPQSEPAYAEPAQAAPQRQVHVDYAPQLAPALAPDYEQGSYEAQYYEQTQFAQGEADPYYQHETAADPYYADQQQTHAHYQEQSQYPAPAPAVAPVQALAPAPVRQQQPRPQPTHVQSHRSYPAAKPAVQDNSFAFDPGGIEDDEADIDLLANEVDPLGFAAEPTPVQPAPPVLRQQVPMPVAPAPIAPQMAPMPPLQQVQPTQAVWQEPSPVAPQPVQAQDHAPIAPLQPGMNPHAAVNAPSPTQFVQPPLPPAVAPPEALRPPRSFVQNFRSPAGAITAARVGQPPVQAPVPATVHIAPMAVGSSAPSRHILPETGGDGFIMPSLSFLSEPKHAARDPLLTQETLEQNARLLEGVLEDFGVKGEIINVRPGPVVTLYELEPAPGIKSSRVIGLADDIARSMSAIAARVAVIPGRNAIGIELPNSRRETVYLRELLASQDFENSKAKLALALGKTINGEAAIADIAKFPHLLVAGTTGSGKSVAINTMILSILYRMTPEECRLIMIDPKMLELSVYDGIPHLLTPVVTDPKKAVVALKWTVREMEDRYRKMSKLGVRNIEGFNSRVREADKKGELINRTVQTGFDRETGEAIYETEELDLKPLPFIVVIIDEMADLMMVAGKEIEGAVQRLAQMARAAGIHVIMATQRPSVDVITGTIKANFPTRISFQVTSKIDSRTILGEQGAEQLLGMGDMLYMAGGGRIQRVHGPFVSDDEVEKVVAHLKTQGIPEYLEAITEDDEDGDGDAPEKSGGSSGSNSNFDDSDDPYDQAVAIVLRDGRASTSYIQRRLGIGYNRAATIIERMENEGIIGAANHAGKREILVPTESAQDDY